MKNLLIKILISSIALVFGIATVFSCNYVGKQNKSDSVIGQKQSDTTVYVITFSEINENPQKYDGKTVRLKALHSYIKDSPNYLFDYDSHGQVRISCVMNQDACAEMWEKVRLIQSMDNFSFYPQVDIVGRFKANADVPNYLGGEEKTNLIEIIEIKSIEPIRKTAAQ
jgi:hypothetical protein